MRRHQHGFSYVIALFLVATLSLLGLRRMQVTITNERRDKEAQLLQVGLAYRNAIQSYYEHPPGSAKAFPPDLKALLEDDRNVSTLRRHLRKLYRDPMGGADWILLPAPDGGVMGVASRSTQAPIKQAGFPQELGEFVLAKTYQDWKFVYLPPKNL